MTPDDCIRAIAEEASRASLPFPARAGMHLAIAAIRKERDRRGNEAAARARILNAELPTDQAAVLEVRGMIG
jgi:hypothetical protein